MEHLGSIIWAGQTAVIIALKALIQMEKHQMSRLYNCLFKVMFSLLWNEAINRYEYNFNIVEVIHIFPYMYFTVYTYFSTEDYKEWLI